MDIEFSTTNFWIFENSKFVWLILNPTHPKCIILISSIFHSSNKLVPGDPIYYSIKSNVKLCDMGGRLRQSLSIVESYMIWAEN